jgi:2-oxoisovalerate dehydrogenase E1 component alpha subunit
MGVKDVAERAGAYGFEGVVVDGNDVLACYEASRKAVERARSGGGPTLVELKTYRFHPHTSDDDDRTYRSREEVEEAKRNDPLIVFAGYLKDQGLLDDDGVESLRAEVKANVDQEADAAWNAPDPEPEDALRHVFADAASAAMGARAGDQGNEKADAFESTGGEATPAESPRSEPGGEG